MALENPLKYETFRDKSHYDLWAVRDRYDRQFNHTYHVYSQKEGERLAADLNAKLEAEQKLDVVLKVMKEIAEGATVEAFGDRYIRVSNPNFREDNGEDPWLVLDIENLKINSKTA